MTTMGYDENERFAAFVRDTAGTLDLQPDAALREEMWATIAARRQDEAMPLVASASSLRTGRDVAGGKHVSTWMVRSVPLRWAVPVACTLMVGGVITGISIGQRGGNQHVTSAAPMVAAVPVVVAPVPQSVASAVVPTPAPVQTSPKTFAVSPASVGVPSTHTSQPQPLVLPSQASSLPVQVAMAEHFSNAAQMLAKFASSDRHDVDAGGADAKIDAKMAAWARELLSTTQVLLDSRVGQDAQRRQLLSDLELVLVQIVQFTSEPLPEDRELVARAIAHSQMIPRLQSAAPSPKPQSGA